MITNPTQISIREGEGVDIPVQPAPGPAIGILDSAFLLWRLRIAKPWLHAKPGFEVWPVRKFSAAVKGDGSARGMGQRGEGADQAVHDWSGLPIIVPQEYRKTARPLNQRCQVGVPISLSELQKIAFPVTKLLPLPYSVGTVENAELGKKTTGPLTPSISWTPACAAFGQVPPQLDGLAVLGMSKPVDRLRAGIPVKLSASATVPFHFQAACDLLGRPTMADPLDNCLP